MNGINQSWAAMYGGVSFAGYALYFTNGTVKAYDLHHNLLNEGVYKIEDGDDYCLETETYRDPLEKDTCQTYSTFQDDKGTQFFIGCGIAENGCTPLTNCDPDWPNYYTSRTTARID